MRDAPTIHGLVTFAAYAETLNFVTISPKSMSQNKLPVQPSTPAAEDIPEGFHHLPKDVGWILLISGLLSELGMPGVPPFWIVGIMILWPETGYKIARPLQKRFPNAFSKSVRMITRYADDLDRRYPRENTKTDEKSGSN